jgi:formylglycine-generating enzyme required for sulfatase activity
MGIVIFIIIVAILYSWIKEITSTEKESSSTEKESSSTGKESSSTEKESSSTGKESSSTGKESSSTEKESSSTGKESSSTEKESSSTEKESSSTEKESSSTEKESSSTGKESSSTEKESSSTEKKTLKETILFVSSNPGKAETVLNEEHIMEPALSLQAEPAESTEAEVTKEGDKDCQEVITVKSEEKAHIYAVLENIAETVLIKKGSFQVGDTSGKGRENEKPPHTVTITYDFYIGKHEITFQEYENEGNVNEPMVGVSWFDAINYCNMLSKKAGLARAYSDAGNLLDKNGKKTSDPSEVEGYRLPTEAEWEYAIGKIDKNEYIWEWCSDWYSENYYKNSPRINPYNSVQGAFRVKRGGSFKDEQDICPSRRSYDYPKRRRDDVGFRVVRTKTLNSPKG